MTSWREHIASYRKKHGVSYKDAMTAAAPSWRAHTQSVKDKADESKGMKGKKKGKKSMTRKNDKDFTTKHGDKDFHEKAKDIKEPRKPYTRTKKVKSAACACGH
jgi:hypothetical protein